MDCDHTVAAILPQFVGCVATVGGNFRSAIVEGAEDGHTGLLSNPEATMPHHDRAALMRAIEALRGGRRLICLMNFDRLSDPYLNGISAQLYGDVKEPLYRVLKQIRRKEPIDLLLYTRGGDINAVWPLVSVLREFDRRFHVLVPYKCHSAGTLLALGAERIIMGPLAELSPVDPSTGNAFNPPEPANAAKKLPISVNDVRAYRHFVQEQLYGQSPAPTIQDSDTLQPFVEKLTEKVHPLALGNVQRVALHIQQLGERLLQLNASRGEDTTRMVRTLCEDYQSHLHMINRHEAKQLLGGRVEHATVRLTAAMDAMLLAYEQDFALRRTLFLHELLTGKADTTFTYAGATVESSTDSWLFQSQARLRQAGEKAPGGRRSVDVELLAQGWTENPGAVA